MPNLEEDDDDDEDEDDPHKESDDELVVRERFSDIRLRDYVRSPEHSCQLFKLANNYDSA